MPEVTNESTLRPDMDRRVCIHTGQITDSCLDKDCIEDLRVYLTATSQAALEAASSVKTRCAELIYTSVDVQRLPYKSGHYAIDLVFYYRVLGDAILSGTRPTNISGLAIFSKRVVLCGGTHHAKTFRSTQEIPAATDLLQCSNPLGVVEALDPMILSAKVREVCGAQPKEIELADIPESIIELFGEEMVLCGEAKRLYVTIGQFSTVRLERDTQLTIPTCEYCAPTRECCDEECCEEDPCELFSRIDFPMRSFFPEACSADIKADTCGCNTCHNN